MSAAIILADVPTSLNGSLAPYQAGKELTPAPAEVQRATFFPSQTGDDELNSLLDDSALDAIDQALSSVALVVEDAEAAARRGDNDLYVMDLLRSTRRLLFLADFLYS